MKKNLIQMIIYTILFVAILILGRSKIPVFSMVTAGAAILLLDIEIAIAVWKKEEEQDGQGHLTVLEIVGIVLAVIGIGYAIVT